MFMLIWVVATVVAFSTNLLEKNCLQKHFRILGLKKPSLKNTDLGSRHADLFCFVNMPGSSYLRVFPLASPSSWSLRCQLLQFLLFQFISVFTRDSPIDGTYPDLQNFIWTSTPEPQHQSLTSRFLIYFFSWIFITSLLFILLILFVSFSHYMKSRMFVCFVP